MGLHEVALNVGGNISLAAFWPDDWPEAAQATLAGAIIALISALLTTMVSLGLKSWFDSATIKTTHKLAVRSSILKVFHTYAGHYINPLSIASGELASYLEQYEILKALDFESSEKVQRKLEAAERAFYHLARFAKYRTAMTGTYGLRGVEPPPGVFLATTSAESRVWDWTPQLWALNVSNVDDEAALVDSLDNERRSGAEALAFLDLARKEGSKLHHLFISFSEWLENNEHLTEIVTVLNALNRLLDYELAQVFSPWYDDAPGPPDAEIAAMKELSKQAKERMGLF